MSDKKREIVFCTTVTKSYYKEFLLLKYSAEQYHRCRWVVSCDKEIYDKIRYDANVDAILNIHVEREGDHVTGTDEEAKSFNDTTFTKFESCRFSIEKYGYALFLDSDTFFVNPLEERFFGTVENDDIQLMASPHYSDNAVSTTDTGFYNSGMFVIKCEEILDRWQVLSFFQKDLNLYFEQKPLEFIVREHFVVDLPLNYNLGWWRFNSAMVHDRLKYLKLRENKIYIGDYPVVNFHVHMLKELRYGNMGDFLKIKILNLLEKSKNSKYTDLFEYYTTLEGES